MATDGIIYFSSSDGELVPLEGATFASEDDLQLLLATHPDLLGGAQMAASDPPRFLLVQREVPVNDHTGTSRWSIDHLFVDQRAIPTFVEVKRSTNTQLRREVVGQMFDYVANGQRHWPPDALARLFESSCRTRNLEPSDQLTEFLDTTDAETLSQFWKQVGENLIEGRVRLLFVADAIPIELQSIVEFLNQQMTNAEVLAVEVRRYVGQGCSALVPRVIGNTSRAKAAKTTTADTAGSFADTYAPGSAPYELALRLADWAQSHGCSFDTSGASAVLAVSGTTVLTVWATTVEFYLHRLIRAGLVAEAEVVREGLVSTTAKALTVQRPNVPITDVLSAWSSYENHILPRYVTAVRQRVGQ